MSIKNMGDGRAPGEHLNYKFTKEFLCAIDGSSFSELAYDCMKSLLKKNDRIRLLHVFSNDDHGPADPDRMKDKWEVELCSHYSETRYSMLWHNNDEEKKPIKTILVEISEGKFGGLNPDFMVIGYSGWRFHSRNDKVTSAGSTADFCLRNIRLPIVIAKKESRMGPKNFFMAVNGSNASKLGLDLLYTLLTPKDSLTLVHVYDDSMDSMGNLDLRSVKKYYLDDLAEHCPTTYCKFEPLMKEGPTPAVRTISNYFDEIEEEIDFFVMAPRAREDRSLSSFTERAILEVKANIILCKL